MGLFFSPRLTSTSRKDLQRTPTDAFFLRFGPRPFKKDSRYLGNREARKTALHEAHVKDQVFSITQVSSIFFKGPGFEAQKERVRRRSLQVLSRGAS